MPTVQISEGRLNSRSSWVIEKRRLQDVQPLMNYSSVKSWIMDHKESARKNALYRFATFVRWRGKMGYSTNPEDWIQECSSGNNMTLVKHLRILKEWVESEDIAGCKDVTRLKYYHNARSFYAFNLITLPQSKLNTRGKKENEIPPTVAATAFLLMISKALSSKISLLWKTVIMIQTQGGMTIQDACPNESHKTKV
ncbi:MAG: hypothetical protein HYU02_04205 [Thaumarchaeota archaeon]|nr:hypothetical protein [Nitrososphaerota archaeon]